MQFINKLIMEHSDNPTWIQRAGTRLVSAETARSNSTTAYNEQQIKILKSQRERLPEERELERLKCEVKGEKALSKHWRTYKVCGTLLAYSSLFLSVSGASGTNPFLYIFQTITNPFAIAVFVLQSTLLAYYSGEYQVKRLYKGTHSKMSLFQFMIISVSVFCNYRYLYGLIGDTAISLILAISFDYGSIAFSELSTVTRYRLLDLNNEAPSILYQLGKVLTYPITNLIEQKYQAIMPEKNTQRTIATNDKTGISLTDRLLEKIEQAPSNTVITKSFLGLEDKPLEWRDIKELAKEQGLCHSTSNKFVRN